MNVCIELLKTPRWVTYLVMENLDYDDDQDMDFDENIQPE